MRAVRLANPKSITISDSFRTDSDEPFETNVLGGGCDLCNHIPNAHEDASYTCTNLHDARVSECRPGYFRTPGKDSHTADTCTPWTVCGANTNIVPGTPTSDAVCTCMPQHYEETVGGLTGLDCIPWTPCAPDVQVSTNGTDLSDQKCGVRVGLTTNVQGAIASGLTTNAKGEIVSGGFLEAIRLAMSSAPGSSVDPATITVGLTAFKQTVETEAVVPGSVDDYADPTNEASAGYVRTLQFRTGVSATLGVDLDQISDLTVSSTGLRRLSVHGRQLQSGSSVSINYEIIVTEPALAASVATKAANTSAFAAALVSNVNAAGAQLVVAGLISQADLDAIPVMNVSDVVVAQPTIETEIEYSVAIETTDPSVGETISGSLGDPQAVSAALYTATGASVQVQSAIECDTTVQFESAPPTNVSGRVCSWLTVCDVPHEYESVPPTADSDRHCTACTEVDNAAPGAIYTCTSQNDTRVSACAQRFFKLVGYAPGENVTLPYGSSDTCEACYGMVDVPSVDSCEVCDGIWQSDCRLGTCARGYHSYADASDVCVACTKGKYNDQLGSADIYACIGCRAGTYATDDANDDVSDCVPCAAGKYSSEQGSTFESNCIPCVRGTWLELTGSDNETACKDCPRGRYLTATGSVSQSACLSCEQGKWSSQLRATVVAVTISNISSQTFILHNNNKYSFVLLSFSSNHEF